MSVRIRTTPNTLRPLDPGLWRRHEASARQPLMVVGADDPGESTKAVEYRVELELTHYAGTRARYRVTYLGKTLIESARDPEFEACRALLAWGRHGDTGDLQPGQLGRAHEDRHRQGCAADDHRQCRRRPSDRSLSTASEIH
jgi:hypothetical protein